MKTIAAVTLLGFAAVLTGCKDTTFESLPSERTTTCDTHFVGKWRLISADNKSSDYELYVIVEPECKRWRFIEDGNDDAKTEQTVHFAFATVGGKPLLALKIDPDRDPAKDPGARWSIGYYYLRYEFADKTIRAHPVDHRRVAHLIVDGAVAGRSERISREPASKSAGNSDELHNFVAGNTEEMARVAQLEGIFDETETYVLKPATDAEIFKPVKKPAKP
jgi:hypothetical protein